MFCIYTFLHVCPSLSLSYSHCLSFYICLYERYLLYLFSLSLLCLSVCLCICLYVSISLSLYLYVSFIHFLLSVLVSLLLLMCFRKPCIFPGLVKTLDGLNIRGNPLVFPPEEVMEKGVKTILGFLRTMLDAKSSGCSLPGDNLLPLCRH